MELAVAQLSARTMYLFESEHYKSFEYSCGNIFGNVETPTVTCAKSNDVVLAASIGNYLKNVLLVENSQSKFLIFYIDEDW